LPTDIGPPFRPLRSVHQPNLTTISPLHPPGFPPSPNTFQHLPPIPTTTLPCTGTFQPDPPPCPPSNLIPLAQSTPFPSDPNQTPPHRHSTSSPSPPSSLDPLPLPLCRPLLINHPLPALPFARTQSSSPHLSPSSAAASLPRATKTSSPLLSPSSAATMNTSTSFVFPQRPLESRGFRLSHQARPALPPPLARQSPTRRDARRRVP
jgi:hypothetical protein